MSRLPFIALMLALGLLASCKPQKAPVLVATETKEPAIEWRLVTSWPKNLPGLGMAAENFATLVNQMSNGRLNIQVYGAGEVMPALKVFDGVSNGEVQMGHSAAYYWKEKIPAAQFFSSIPFGMNADQMNTWLFYGGGMELWRETYEPYGVIPFAGGFTGMQMGGWFNKEINSIEDLQGLKMRLPGLGGEVLRAVGGIPYDNLAGRELFSALQTGVIDAAEWVGPYNDKRLGLYKVAKYYYYPGWHEPSGAMEFLVNEQAFNELPEDLQVIVTIATRAINQDMLNDYTYGHVQSMPELINRYNVIVKPFPVEVIRELKQARSGVLDKVGRGDAPFAKVRESYLHHEKLFKQFYDYTHGAMVELDE
ncbi:TRAP transporter substrate-binding protein [Shewanella sp. WXL01]|nr:TRAP transporter substrate-binding protein [Shewanella sp. WXL01]